MNTPHIHTDPILGAMCAHVGEAVALWWLGPGTTHTYVGRCMNEPTVLPMSIHRIDDNPGFDYCESAKGFRKLIAAFMERSAA